MADTPTETPPAEETVEETAEETTEAVEEEVEEVDESVKLYVGNLSYTTNDARLREEFGKYGELTDVFLPSDRITGRPRGFGFVTFSTKASAEDAIENLNAKELDGRVINVNHPRPRGETGGGRGGGGRGSGGRNNDADKDDTKLYVGNLSFDTTLESVRVLFEEHGVVSDCFLPTNRETGKPRGFGFVTMSKSDAEKAVEEVNGHELDGRTLRVNEARGRYDSGYGGRGRRRY